MFVQELVVIVIQEKNLVALLITVTSLKDNRINYPKERNRIMRKDGLSDTEGKLFDYIKEKRYATYDEIRKDLGEQYIGASGKLIQRELVEKSKRATGEKQPQGYGRIGTKYVKVLEIKK